MRHGFFSSHEPPNVEAHRAFYARGGHVGDDLFTQYGVVQNAFADGGQVGRLEGATPYSLEDLLAAIGYYSGGSVDDDMTRYGVILNAFARGGHFCTMTDGEPT